MASTPTNPNPRHSKNVHHVGGIPVEFPYQPYGSQLAFMGRVISTLDRAQRDGHCHALLESPTGTGKSLSLLCSALAWQQNCKAKGQYANPSQSKPDPEALTDPLAYGGGFIPDTQPTSVAVPENLEPTQSGANNKNQKKKIVPTIYYATRTHSQISQVIREYRKTSYRVPMAVLASRKHYCTNSKLRGKENIDEECKLLLKNRDVGCAEFRNVNKVKGHPSLKKGGCHEAHDIEDLVKVGQVVKGCSYYAARSMAEDAHLVFCPYNYIINPVIRGAMEVDIKGAIVILDEAHNIEDIARDAGSIDLEEDVLHKLQMELEPLCLINSMIYQPIYEMTQDLTSWIERKKNTLEKREFQRYCSCWTGDKALRELQEANISQQCFPALLECATKAIKAATDTESDGESDAAHLSGMSVITLEGLFSSLTYFFSSRGCHKFDYQLALQRYVRRDARRSMGDWTHTLSLWCLNPAVVFSDVANLSLSVILTSGTLSPMNSFSSELGVQFGTCLEAPHVVDVKTQVWASIISTGSGDYPLNASYKTADGLAFQDALGNTLEEICKIVPGGALVFFPSYKLMEKLCNRWRETGQWSRLNAKKSLFVEPKGGSQDDFEPTLKDYYASICGGKKHTVRRKGRMKKMDPNHFNVMEPQESDKKGAAFLAVCRGKVSEGIDFSDDNARVVIVVGIPFPNITDIQVSLKKKYNDTYKSSKDLLSGNEWYCHQAFRALNQAAGRCIRHRFDYGAIILLDERFREERNSVYISKWLRKSIRQYESFDLSLESLKSFFRDVKEQVGKNAENVLQNSESTDENISSTNQKQFMREKNQTGNKLDHRKFVSGKKCDDTFTQLNSQGKQTDNMDICNQPNYNDLECNFDKDLRCPGFLSVTSSHEDLAVTIKETPGIDGSITAASPGSFSKDENSSSSVIQVSTEFPEQFSPQSMSLADPSRAPSKAQCSMAVTPKKNATENTYSMLPEIESSLNLSVNSHTQKRRKAMGSRLVNFIQAEQFDAPDAKSPGCISFVGSSLASGDSSCRIEFGSENNPVEHKSKKLNLTPLLRMNEYVTSNVCSGPVMDRRLQISCSLCRSLLGRPENPDVMCSLSLLSKVYLASLLRGKSDPVLNMSTGIPVIITDISAVNQQLCNRTLRGEGRGIWCEEDGCVFDAIFCPFCCTCNNCLGVEVMATNALNVQLLNKILFYADHLEIKNFEASKDQVVTDSGMDKVSVLNSIDKFAYSPKQLNSEGWRTTKSKLRLPKRG